MNLSSLNPGIRKTVKFLNDMGFETTDSGDGKTHDFECDRDYPYVVILIRDRNQLVNRSLHLMKTLQHKGIQVNPVGHGWVEIESSYDPVNDIGIINVHGLDDDTLMGCKDEETETS